MPSPSLSLKSLTHPDTFMSISLVSLLYRKSVVAKILCLSILQRIIPAPIATEPLSNYLGKRVPTCFGFAIDTHILSFIFRFTLFRVRQQPTEHPRFLFIRLL
jgi:hypothetical protein